MRNLKDIDINKSIEQKKLIYPEKWYEKLDQLGNYFIFSWFFILPFLIYFDPYRDQMKTGFEYYLVFAFSLFGVYAIYRKATEKRLLEIVTQNDVEKNKELVKKYCEKLGYVQYRNSKNLMIFNATGFLSMRPTDKTSRIFIFKDKYIHFTVIKDNVVGNGPVLTTHLILKNDLKKLVAR